MDLTVNDDFIEMCAKEYFKSFALRQDFTFEQYVKMRAINQGDLKWYVE